MTDARSIPFRRGIGIALILSLAIALVFLLGLRVMGRASEEGEERPMPVSAMRVEMQDAYTIVRGFTGRAVARRRADLGFELGGTLNRLDVDSGDRVDRGAVLAVLNTDRLEARRRELRADLGGAESNLELARKTLERNRQLFQDGHVSQQRLDEAVAAADAAAARRAQLAAAVAAVEVDLDKATLQAPFAGVIERRYLDEGTVVDAGRPVVRLIEADTLEAEVGLPLSFAQKMEPGDHVPLRTETDDLIFAEVKSVVPAVRGETRTALVTLRLVGNVAKTVADGSLVTAELADRIAARGFWIPLNALTADVRGLWRVYKIVETDDKSRRVVFENVQLLHSDSDRAFVTGTVRDGDLLIDGGVERVSPGKRVEVVRVDETGVAGGA